MLITGHRGASGLYPENSMLAFKKAFEQGANAIELDVHRCKTGEMVVIHDETVDRTMNGTGRVADLTLAELKALDGKDGQKIVTLDEVLEMVGGKATVFIEMKGPGNAEVAKSIHKAVKEQGFSYDQLPVISFDHSRLFLLKLRNPHIQTGLSFSKRTKLERTTMVPLAKTLGASSINPYHVMVDKELVEEAHKAGLSVNPWTVNRPEVMERMHGYGVDAIMTNYPDKLHNVVHQTKEQNRDAGSARHP